MDVGRCSENGCYVQDDFLPFLCPQCERYFCSDHRSRFKHTCNGGVNQTTNIPPKGHVTSNVKEQLDSITHRFDHLDESKPSMGDSKAHLKFLTTTSGDDSSMASSHSRILQKVDKLNSLEGRSNSNDSGEKSKSIARKTKEILIAKNAIGNPSIEAKSRFYLVVNFDYSQEQALKKATIPSLGMRHLYFSDTATLGDILHNIANEYSNLAFGTAIRPSNKSLALYTEDTTNWRMFDLNTRVKDILTSFENIYVIPVESSEIVENQSRLLAQSVNSSNTSSSELILSSSIILPINNNSNNSHTTITTFNTNINIINDTTTTTPSILYEVGNEVIYTSSSGEKENVKILGRHHDDFPNIYYTIQHASGNERQTPSSRLSPSASILMEESITTSLGTYPPPPPKNANIFSIQIVYNGQIHTISGVYDTMLISQLKTYILTLLGINLNINSNNSSSNSNSSNNSSNSKSSSTMKGKLIYKGKVLKDSESVEQSKVMANVRLTLMASST